MSPPLRTGARACFHAHASVSGGSRYSVVPHVEGGLEATPPPGARLRRQPARLLRWFVPLDASLDHNVQLIRVFWIKKYIVKT